MSMPAQAVVLDTNVALDLLVFADPACAALRTALQDGQLQWLACESMAVEMQRVLTYAPIARSLAYRALEPQAVLQNLRAQARWVSPAPKAPYTCKDADDQVFIDLAVAHRATLLSKDKAVLCMAKRLHTLGVHVARNYAGA